MVNLLDHGAEIYQIRSINPGGGPRRLGNRVTRRARVPLQTPQSVVMRDFDRDELEGGAEKR
jgi:hypothetical protein